MQDINTYKNDNNSSGYFRKTTSGYKAFFPQSLPPEPVIALTGALQLQLSAADRALDALNMVISVLPKRNRKYIYKNYVDILAEGTEITG
jgi:hypothetical protein